MQIRAKDVLCWKAIANNSASIIRDCAEYSETIMRCDELTATCKVEKNSSLACLAQLKKLGVDGHLGYGKSRTVWEAVKRENTRTLGRRRKKCRGSSKSMIEGR